MRVNKRNKISPSYPVVGMVLFLGIVLLSPRHHANNEHLLVTQFRSVASPLSLDTTKKCYILNFGCHGNPPTPFDDVFVVGVEPLIEIAANIPRIPDRYILAAAISDNSGIAEFYHFLDSSSLLKPFQENQSWHSKGLQGQKILVPTLDSKFLMASLTNYKCLLLKTDMQGMDFQAVKGMGHFVQECHWVFSEVYCHNFSSYQNTHNDMEKDWLPLMSSLGFEAQNGCQHGESNILWKNTRFTPREISESQCPDCFN